jgi:hypothetical protein
VNPNNHSVFSSGGRYPVLRSIAIIYLILGIVSILAGIAAVCWMLIAAPFAVTDRIILAAAAAVGAIFWCALMLGAAEVIKLFVDMEHNTRMMPMYRPMTPMSDAPDPDAHTGRFSVLEEETAEAALILGH